MSELTKKDRWEIGIKGVGAVFAGLSIIASVFIYLHGNRATLNREHELITTRQKVEYDRQLWGQLRAAYKALAQTLGQIAAELESENKVSPESRAAFNTAYWGALILVEDEAVGLEMVKLRNDMRDLEAGRIDQDKIKLRIERIVSLGRKHIMRGRDEIDN